MVNAKKFFPEDQENYKDTGILDISIQCCTRNCSKGIRENQVVKKKDQTEGKI